MFLHRPRLGLPPASRLRPPPSPLSSPQQRGMRLARREGSRRSASEAFGEAANSAAPAWRPTPGLGPAPKWWQRRRWPRGEGTTPGIRWPLPGAHRCRTHARSAASAAPRAERCEGAAAGRGPAAAGVKVAVGRLCLLGFLRAGLRLSLGSRPRPECCLCLCGSHVRADSTREKSKASPEQAVTQLGKGARPGPTLRGRGVSKTQRIAPRKILRNPASVQFGQGLGPLGVHTDAQIPGALIQLQVPLDPDSTLRATSLKPLFGQGPESWEGHE